VIHSKVSQPGQRFWRVDICTGSHEVRTPMHNKLSPDEKSKSEDTAQKLSRCEGNLAKLNAK
jgi:hypothetical protein